MKSRVLQYIEQEEKRQKNGIELIASENYVSNDVLRALGSILTNKYSEGYPGHRYYKGNQYIDEIEIYAKNLVTEIFKYKYVNVQPYSGSPANQAVHFALLNHGDNTLGMDLSSGGHLTHGFKVSFSGKQYNSMSYGVDSDGYIDYDEVKRIARQHKPKIIWVGASAYSRIIDYKKFKEIAEDVGSILVADIAHIAGLIAGGVIPSPYPYADVVTTTTHKTLRGPRGGIIMTDNPEFAQLIDKAIFPGLQGGPHNNVIGAIAICLEEAKTPDFRKYTENVIKNAQKLSSEIMNLGYNVISKGTDNHLMLVDISNISSDIGGEEISTILEKINITVNKNSIPKDNRKPSNPSGIRIGTPAITTRGASIYDMKIIANFIHQGILFRDDSKKLDTIKHDVVDYISKYPIYFDL